MKNLFFIFIFFNISYAFVRFKYLYPNETFKCKIFYFEFMECVYKSSISNITGITLINEIDPSKFPIVIHEVRNGISVVPNNDHLKQPKKIILCRFKRIYNKFYFNTNSKWSNCTFDPNLLDYKFSIFLLDQNNVMHKREFNFQRNEVVILKPIESVWVHNRQNDSLDLCWHNTPLNAEILDVQYKIKMTSINNTTIIHHNKFYYEYNVLTFRKLIPNTFYNATIENYGIRTPHHLRMKRNVYSFSFRTKSTLEQFIYVNRNLRISFLEKFPSMRNSKLDFSHLLNKTYYV